MGEPVRPVDPANPRPMRFLDVPVHPGAAAGWHRYGFLLEEQPWPLRDETT